MVFSVRVFSTMNPTTTSGSNLSFSSWTRKFVLKPRSLIVVFAPKIHGASSKVFQCLGWFFSYQTLPDKSLTVIPDIRKKSQEKYFRDSNLGRRRAKKVQFVHVFDLIYVFMLLSPLLALLKLSWCLHGLLAPTILESTCSISRSSAERWHWEEGKHTSRNTSFSDPLHSLIHLSINAKRQWHACSVNPCTVSSTQDPRPIP